MSAARQRIRSRALTARERRLILLGLLAFLALALGFIGYLRRDYGAADAAYASLQLFGFSMVEPRNVPLELNIARFLAPLALGYAVLEALGALLRDHAEGLRAMTKRNHVVVAGLGDTGRRLAETLSDAGDQVVAIERSSGGDALRRVRDRGVLGVHGDARDQVILRRAGVGSAAYLLVTCGPDETNVDVAQRARELVREQSARTLTVVVHLAEAATRRLLSAQAVADSTAAQPARLEYFNLREAAAHALASMHSPWAGANGAAAARDPHALIAGVDGVAEELVVRLATTAAARPPGGSRLRVTLMGPGARALRERVASEHPGLASHADVEAVEASSGALGTMPLEGTPAVTVAYVCLGAQVEALEAALALTRRPDLHGNVVLTVDDADSGIAVALQAVRGPLSRVRIFGIYDAALTRDLLRAGVTESLARAKHEHYVLCEHERGIEPAANASMVAWEELDEDKRESNRAFADAVGDKLATMGCVLVPAPLGSATGAAFEPPAELVEALAVDEHDRWMADLERRGIEHHKRVPWSALTEEDRDKDREPVRDLPLILRQAGLEVVPLDGGLRS
jgi:hypothetical protein